MRIQIKQKKWLKPVGTDPDHPWIDPCSALKEGGEEDEDDSKLLDNDDESWVDEVELLSDEERVMFEREVRPVKMALVKVRTAVVKVAKKWECLHG